MADDVTDGALVDPHRKLPPPPEAPDTAEPPGAAGLEADVRVSLEPTPAVAMAKIKPEPQGS